MRGGGNGSEREEEVERDNNKPLSFSLPLLPCLLSLLHSNPTRDDLIVPVYPGFFHDCELMYR